MKLYRRLRRQLTNERGAILLTTLFFLFCMCGLISILLLIGQASVAEMRTQQTADLVTKGARAAGKGVYKGEARLFATTREANQQKVEIIRGAREEAEILVNLNKSGLEKSGKVKGITHQKGNLHYLYAQGIYHLRIELQTELVLMWDALRLTFQKVSQSEV
ncbi:hypothetical protein [Brevibacillus fulvus]|uniref:Uncharacterized protein n=1 Tax=Brevibacillus fulvus TaxID=1125967 RepID=A0A938Y1N4_9BACL|nr:hypothetical protein [Brevibacillus fulvus]MBM7592299.1 hypothetical protein [Brevibacillus fulvus]